MTATLTLDGRNVTGVTLSGVTITRGRESLGEDPSAGVCVATLLSGDIDPGAWQGVSGYTDAYADEWLGQEVAARVGVPLVVETSGVSGYTDAYADEWAGSGNVRFTGTVTAVDYTPGELTVTAVDAVEQLGRVYVKDPRPGETDFSRAFALANLAGVTMGYLGQVTATLVEQETAPTRTTVLEALTATADNTAATFYADRLNALWYRRRDAALVNTVTLPAEVTLTEALIVSQELGEVYNTELVAYGKRENRRTASASDPESVAKYGPREWPVMETELAGAKDAENLADYWLAIDKDAAYRVASAQVVIYGEAPEFHAAADALDLYSRVVIPQLPAGSPVASFSAVLLGYTETITEQDRTLALHLAPPKYGPEGTPSYAASTAA